MGRLRRVIERATLLLLGTLVALALLEVGLRATAWLLARSRAPAHLATRPTRGVIRILCLGESTTFGTGPGAADAYPPQLEHILNERSRHRRYQVFNGGMPATTTDRILAALGRSLDGIHPNIVVAMMGINDRPVDDPMFSVTDSLRVVKLGRLLAAGAAHVLAGDDDGGPRIAEIPRVDGRLVPTMPQRPAQQLFFAGGDILAGRLDAAERVLTPLAEIAPDQDAARAIATKAEGELVVLNAQRRRPDEVARHRLRYRELVGPQLNPATVTNYLALVQLLAARGIPLIAVEYPARSAQPLRDLLANADNVLIVDNEDTFIRASSERPLDEIYLDLFAGIFGHMTATGHRLLATNVADAVESIVGQPPRRPRATP